MSGRLRFTASWLGGADGITVLGLWLQVEISFCFSFLLYRAPIYPEPEPAPAPLTTPKMLSASAVMLE